MKLAEIGEFGLIARIRNSWPESSLQVIQGMGDDEVEFFLGPESNLISVVAFLIEDVRFDFSLLDSYPLSRKSMTINLIDPAAMGATPRCDST